MGFNLLQWIDAHIEMIQESIYVPFSDLINYFKNDFPRLFPVMMADLAEELAPGTIPTQVFTKAAIEEAAAHFSKEGIPSPYALGQIGKVPSWMAVLSSIPAILEMMRAPSKGFIDYLEEQSRKAYQTARIDIGTYIQARRRSLTTKVDIDDDLYGQGWNDDRLELILEASKPIPDLSSLISYWSKGVDTDYEIEAYGLNNMEDGFIKGMKAEIEALGIDEKEARRQWRSHWMLPGYGDLRTMLHRGLITPADMELMLMRIGVPLKMAPLFVSMAYEPLNKRDLNQAFKAGLLSDDELHSRLMLLGYSPEDASLIVSGLEASTKGKQIGDTSGLIEDAYKKGAITRQDALAHLETLGYKPEDADLVLSIIDLDQRTRINDEWERIYEDEALKGLKTVDEFKTALNGLGLTQTAVNQKIEQLQVKLHKDRPIPDKSDLAKFYKGGLIDEPTYRSMMAGLGYHKDAIDLYELVNAPAIDSGGP